MKKLYLIVFGVAFSMGLFSSVGWAVETKKAPEGSPKTSEVYLKHYQKRTTHKPSQKRKQEVAKFFDTKIYHDPFYVSQIAEAMQSDTFSTGKKQVAKTQEKEFNTLLGDKDAKALKNGVSSVKMTNPKTPDLQKKVYQDPHGTYVDIIMDQRVEPLGLNSMEQMQAMDRKTLTEVQQLATSAGPDFGANSVSVRYQE